MVNNHKKINIIMKKILLLTVLLISISGCSPDYFCPTVIGVDYYVQNGVIVAYYLELSNGNRPQVSMDDYYDYDYGDTYCK